MRYVSFSHEGKPGYGCMVDDVSIFDLGRVTGLPDLKSHIATHMATLDAEPPGRPDYRLDEVELLPVIPNADKILCVAVNYRESDAPDEARPDYPMVFTRFANAQAGHEQPLLKPQVSDRFDYEGELAVIIGRPCHRIGEDEALQHIAGYSCFNDGSVRDWQKHSSQFTPGKNFLKSGGFGPWMVSVDEVPDPFCLDLTTRVNGEARQSTNTSRMLFSIPWLISYFSRFTRLEAGDVIVTGTPRGFGSSMLPPKFLGEGDTVEVEISGVGTLRNRVSIE